MADDLKKEIDTLERVHTSTSARFWNAPQWIRDMPPEELTEKEKSIRRKIDLRLCVLRSLPYTRISRHQVVLS